MSDEMKIDHANEVYADLCAALDRSGIVYEKDVSKLVCKFTVNGADIPMRYYISVDTVRQVLMMISYMPFVFPEDKRIEGAIAACHSTKRIVDGSFDLNVFDGYLRYRLTSSIKDGTVTDAVLNYLLSCACAVIDEFNDKFNALIKGSLSLDEFLAS